MCSVVWFIKVTRPLGLSGGWGCPQERWSSGGTHFVVRLPGQSLVLLEEGKESPRPAAFRMQPQHHGHSSFPLLWEEARLQFWPLSLTNSSQSHFHSGTLVFLDPDDL